MTAAGSAGWAAVMSGGPFLASGYRSLCRARRVHADRPARLDCTLRISRYVVGVGYGTAASPSQRVSGALAASSDGPAAGAHDRCACMRKWIPMTDAVLSTNAPDAQVEPAPLAGHAPVKPDSPLFSDFAVKPEIVQALADVGIEHTFAIQE